MTEEWRTPGGVAFRREAEACAECRDAIAEWMSEDGEAARLYPLVEALHLMHTFRDAHGYDADASMKDEIVEWAVRSIRDAEPKP